MIKYVLPEMKLQTTFTSYGYFIDLNLPYLELIMSRA